MSKLLVVDEEKETKVPFLRGMLIKSLQRSGLEFVDAYKLASEIREDLDDVESITTDELRDRIVETLGEDYPDIVLSRYQKEVIYTESTEVVYEDGSGEPFSRGVFVKRLINCGIPQNQCNAITREVHSQLIREKTRKIPITKLIALTYQVTKDKSSQKYADHYLIWCDFQRQNIPLLILIGGVPGSGKSTVATELANRLSIVRTQSTDMLREVMRALIPKRLSPSLHQSSFNAGTTVSKMGPKGPDKIDPLFDGFQMQSDMVAVACEAVLSRAINERVSMILEGVHMRPGLYQKLRKKDVIMVPVVLAVLQQKRLKHNYKGRSDKAEKRAAQRYLDNFDKIWQLQTAILSDADAADIEIIDNDLLDETVSEVCRTVTETIATTYKGRIKALRAEYYQA